MSVMAISPVPFVNAASLANTQPEAQSHLQEDAQRTTAQISSDVSSSGSAATAVQAFMAFQPDVQPIASLNPPEDTQPALPTESSTDLSGATPQWSGTMVDVYA
jgi:hypothetical protein